ncbi:MAG: response regulator [Flavobacteriales bacterium]|nr:response regulator [Flavobacteriales bacterium]MCB9447778.1 response regulator [Flavobacteriales bacterium]
MKKLENMTVYLVDDNTTNLEIIKHKLRGEVKCKVRTFNTAEDCLRTVEWKVPDLVLADYNLDACYSHKMNGDHMLVQIKSKHPSVPVVMYSSMNSVDLTVNLMKRGAVDFIPRDERFLKRIGGVVSKQMNQVVDGYKEQRARAGFIALLIVLVGSVFVVSYAFSELLPYFVVSALFLGIVFTMVIPSLVDSFKRKRFKVK